MTNSPWFELLKTIIGPLIAAVVVILGLIWRDRIERRNVAQAWFEQTYITEGIDVLIAHVASLQNSVFQRRGLVAYKQQTFVIVPLPSRTMWQLFMIVPGVPLFPAVSQLESIVIAMQGDGQKAAFEKEDLYELMIFSAKLLTLLEHVRVELLNTRVHAKVDAYLVARNTTIKKLMSQAESDFLSIPSMGDLGKKFLLEQTGGGTVQTL